MGGLGNTGVAVEVGWEWVGGGRSHQTWSQPFPRGVGLTGKCIAATVNIANITF